MAFNLNVTTLNVLIVYIVDLVIFKCHYFRFSLYSLYNKKSY